MVRTAFFWEGGTVTFNDGFNGNTLEDDDEIHLSGEREKEGALTMMTELFKVGEG